ncbi:MAG: chorismate synthase [Archangiaceae bacterium]|nr:chorismate synthase [Archangiaceae bacterium]
MNTFGRFFRVTTFGESHGPALGAVIDGCPARVRLELPQVQASLDRRRPGASALASPRREPDSAELLSGVFEGQTLGTPIAFVVWNRDARPSDYDSLAAADRPGHADAVWRARFGHRDHRGGGRTSGRETVGRVLGGAVADAFLTQALPELRVVAWVAQVGAVICPPVLQTVTRAQVDAAVARCPDAPTAAIMGSLIAQAREAHDSLGGAIDVRIAGLPVGLGEPVFGKLKATLAAGFASIGAVTGVTWGLPDVARAVAAPGSKFHTSPRAYGGIQGGLSNGEPIEARVYFKPPASIGELARSGRHDPCIAPRAVPVVEAMASLCLADLLLASRAWPPPS